MINPDRGFGLFSLLAAIAAIEACTITPEQERTLGAADAAQIDSQMRLFDTQQSPGMCRRSE